MALTEKQVRFCDEYMANGGNAYQAALSAGYAETTAHDAHRWVRTEDPNKPHRQYKPEMIAYIAAHSDAIERHNNRIATAEELQQFTSAVVRGEVKEIVVTASGKKVEVPASIKDRLKGADMMARMKGLYNDKLDINADLDINVNIDYGGDG